MNLFTTPQITSQNVRFGYFTEARPILVGCARGWFDTGEYQVNCFPQSSGLFALSKLDSQQLDVAVLGSTPLAMGLARGVDLQVVYIEQYKGESQGIYSRASKGIETPFDLRGKIVGVPFGSTMHYQLLFIIDLFMLRGDITVVDLSPAEIINAWDDGSIDAAACWGRAREHLLKIGKGNFTSSLPANILLTSGVIANWGRPTFNVVVARREFAEQNAAFMRHFVGVLSSLNDSYLDRMGELDSDNVRRWDTQRNAPQSWMPSLADVLMNPYESAGRPSRAYINLARRSLDLFIQQSREKQLSCDYLGKSGFVESTKCYKPTLLHISIQQTAKFLLDQKVIANLGPLTIMDDSSKCRNPNTFCGSDILDPKWLEMTCVSCDLKALEVVTTSFAANQLGRNGDGDSTCSPSQTITRFPTQFGDGANAHIGKSYSDDRRCVWIIRSPNCSSTQQNSCGDMIGVTLKYLNLWIGDYVRFYTNSTHSCTEQRGPYDILLGQFTGLKDFSKESSPKITAQGCLVVEFISDGNQEAFYGKNNFGDGFQAEAEIEANYGCNGFQYDSKTNLCMCQGSAWGGDCKLDYCSGNNLINLSEEAVNISSSRYSNSENIFSTGSPSTYLNDMDCTFSFQVPARYDAIQVIISYQLEDTFDLIYLQTGALGGIGQNSAVKNYFTLSGSGQEETYIIPTDKVGMASLRLQTDSLGRRNGFYATVEAVSLIYICNYQECPSCNYQGCPSCELGRSGVVCEIPYCQSQTHLIGGSSINATAESVLGRVISQMPNLSVRPMPWERKGGCRWKLLEEGRAVDQIYRGVRLSFNRPLDLESYPDGAAGDMLVVRSAKEDLMSIYVQECETNVSCSYSWQTGVCLKDKICELKQAIDIPVDHNQSANIFIDLVTDRNDGGYEYDGVDFSAFLLAECSSEEGKMHCEAVEGNICIDGGCYCGKEQIPCNCPCDSEKPITIGKMRTGLVVGIVVPLFLIFFGVFVWYRHSKILKSREQKRLIEEKEAELEAFRNSVVGMRTAIKDLIPTLVLEVSKEMAPSKSWRNRKVSMKSATMKSVTDVTWCWQETAFVMPNHDADAIFGDPEDCWIKYDESSNKALEAAFQRQCGSGTFSPLPGYIVDFDTMVQTKTQTGFQRHVQRHVEQAASSQVASSKPVGLGEIDFAAELPVELHGEPQMVLVKGDIIQISSQRQDGWAFGTKLHHQDEALAKQLSQVATRDLDSDESNIFTDTGWFELDATEVPSGDDLAALQTSVGDTNALAAPSYWDEVKDPSIVEMKKLYMGNPERKQLEKAFMSTLNTPAYNKSVKIISVHRIQNLAMWQSYVVKLQTICYRESRHMNDENQDNAKEIQRMAHERFERRWLWHGTNNEVMDKIMQQGFNRSFCGKNATMYGKGVYFARDASYSAYPTYAIPDKRGNQYIMACRVAVGEYCRGRKDALTPDIRDAKTQSLYDSTVGLLSRDTMASPSIYVTYHDAQAYPEYLITFNAS